ncbi:MAG: metalloregulator ArsR/SmtB family transcription factor [Rhizobiaceae bacterium]|nr:metalloregulator ArsR/SmtB family transcription factor [Rhizobiaceae bacterium]
MSNPSRLMIMCHLVEREHSVTELEQIIDISQSALSQHLAILRRQRLVSSRRDKRLIYYSISSNRAVAVIETLYEHFCCPEGEVDKVTAKKTT